MAILITGANRGIGLALTRAYAQRGLEIFATARKPGEAKELNALAKDSQGKLRVLPLEVTSDTSCQALRGELANENLEIVINNAGVGGPFGGISEIDPEEIKRIIDVNSVGPLRVAKALLPVLTRSRTRFVNVSSLMGSIGDNSSGKAFGYRMSKAALNMAVKSMAIELGEQGVTCVAIHPGWVQTDMGGPNAPTDVTLAATQIVSLIDKIQPSDSGKFLNAADGRQLPF